MAPKTECVLPSLEKDHAMANYRALAFRLYELAFSTMTVSSWIPKISIRLLLI